MSLWRNLSAPFNFSQALLQVSMCETLVSKDRAINHRPGLERTPSPPPDGKRRLSEHKRLSVIDILGVLIKKLARWGCNLLRIGCSAGAFCSSESSSLIALWPLGRFQAYSRRMFEVVNSQAGIYVTVNTSRTNHYVLAMTEVRSFRNLILQGNNISSFTQSEWIPSYVH